MSKKYETVYIMRADLTEEMEKKLKDRTLEVIQKFQGKVSEAKDLGKKPLAYCIGKHTKGHYVQINFEGGGEVIAELERHLKLTEDIIRFLTIRLVQTRDILEHRTGPQTGPQEVAA